MKANIKSAKKTSKEANLNKTIPLVQKDKAKNPDEYNEYSLQVQARQKENLKKIKELQELKQEKRQKRFEKNAKKTLAKLHHHQETHNKTYPIAHLTKAQKNSIRDEQRKRKNAQSIYNNFKMSKDIENKSASQKVLMSTNKPFRESLNKYYLTKKQKSKAPNFDKLAKRRIERLTAKQVNEFLQAKKKQKDIQAYIASENRRKVKKIYKNALYTAKGGVLVPKFKITRPLRNYIVSESTTKSTNAKVQRYITRVQRIDQKWGDDLGAILCPASKLESTVRYHFERMMKNKREAAKIIGYFIYNDGYPNKCIMELRNPLYEEINGKTTSRIVA